MKLVKHSSTDFCESRTLSVMKSLPGGLLELLSMVSVTREGPQVFLVASHIENFLWNICVFLELTAAGLTAIEGELFRCAASRAKPVVSLFKTSASVVCNPQLCSCVASDNSQLWKYEGLFFKQLLSEGASLEWSTLLHQGGVSFGCLSAMHFWQERSEHLEKRKHSRWPSLLWQQKDAPILPFALIYFQCVPSATLR